MDTHRARMCITVWLPNEVLTEIIQNALKADQARLCRVCKLLHALALPILNRDVTLRPDSLELQDPEAFCSSIIQSPIRADSVHSVTLINRSSYSVRTKELIIECLQVMQRLDHLCIDDSRPELVARLHGDDTRIADGTLLPKLQFYRGPIRFLRCFSAHSLIAVRTVWNAPAPSLVELLAAQTGPNVALDIDFMSETEVVGILVRLSTHMPHLKKLKLRCGDRNSVAAAVSDTAKPNHNVPTAI
ncbi:hypothetical protein FB45DRAFT_162164 [Roridomyces roridus]|uniref:F-box domain-containing protein n=1 Tax=Roridomyces roridus TaxID=1738132 RepID=A0AAD7FET3_9AGAR|nr:hypothetical protein FB45DRAFT_162164 [Roridomyces roridus]